MEKKRAAEEAWTRGVWRRQAIPSQGDFCQSGGGAEVLKKTVQAEQLKRLAEADLASSGEAAQIQRPQLCPVSIKFLETFTQPVVPRAVKTLRVIRRQACLSAVRGSPVKRGQGRKAVGNGPGYFHSLIHPPTPLNRLWEQG